MRSEKLKSLRTIIQERDRKGAKKFKKRKEKKNKMVNWVVGEPGKVRRLRSSLDKNF